MKSTIHFYSTKDEYGCFSNFAPYPIVLKGKTWPTAETHWFRGSGSLPEPGGGERGSRVN